MTTKNSGLDNQVLPNSKCESWFAMYTSNRKRTGVTVEHFCNSNFSLFEPKLLSKLHRL
jgi:iron-sulfur cluster repair protein YtfE (RIC family)